MHIRILWRFLLYQERVWHFNWTNVNLFFSRLQYTGISRLVWFKNALSIDTQETEVFNSIKMNPFPVYYHQPLLHSMSIQAWQRLIQIWIDEICSGRSKEIRREFLKFDCLNRTQTDILYLFDDCHLLLAVWLNFDSLSRTPRRENGFNFWLGRAHLQSRKHLMGQLIFSSEYGRSKNNSSFIKMLQ